jgi:putative addiction module killer protein
MAAFYAAVSVTAICNMPDLPILARVSCLQQGNYGDCEVVGDGVYELRLFFGSGYRVYFGEEDNHIVVLLCGGDKGSQSKDIEQAKAYWKEYLIHEHL